MGMYRESIKVGLIVSDPTVLDHIRHFLPYGPESFAICVGESAPAGELPRLADAVLQEIDGKAVVSSLGIFGNPLKESEEGARMRLAWERAIDGAHRFGTDLVTGFAGRVEGRPVEASIPRFREVFGSLADRAGERGVRLAFENCEMGGTWQSGGWNIAITPIAWEMMFEAVPGDHLGLQWEPCHQMVKLIDPLPQLRKWVKRVFHVHGKDATVMWDVIREHGIIGPKQFAYHRTPGFGDTNWADVITVLRMGGFSGSIDIEGYHDPVYRDELEATGQVRALRYLKECRGGEYVPNP